MSGENPKSRFASEIERLKQQFLVGRDREIRFFQERLASNSLDCSIINLYGTGGVGKSYLLDEFRRLTEKAAARFIYMDCRLFTGSPYEFCKQLLHLLDYTSAQADTIDFDIAALTALCLREIHTFAEQGKLVLALDTFEEIGELELWLREHFLLQLSSGIQIVIAGRLPLQGLWLSSPAWRYLLFRMPLSDLDYEAVQLYLSRSGIKDEENIQYIWTRTKGHPLTLSLLVSTSLVQSLSPQSDSGQDSIFNYVARVWLKEVTNLENRDLIEAAAVLRHFNQELLSFVVDREVPAEQFQKLIGHSFIRKTEYGWILHDMLRDAIGYELRLRAPENYDRLWKRCARLYYGHMTNATLGKSAEWARADWVYYIGDRLIRTLFYQHDTFYQLEPLHSSNWMETEQYVKNRYTNARDVKIIQKDLESGERYEYSITAAEGLFGFKHFQLQQRYDIDSRSVKLIRNMQGELCGLASMIPIHTHTLGFLQSNPPFSDYFSGLSGAEINKLKSSNDAVSGYFIELIDVYDYSNPAMRHAAGLTFIHCMLSAGLIVTTAPAIPFFHTIFRSFGFERVKDSVHFAYDSQIPTPYFVLDTRGKKLKEYLGRMTAPIGIEQKSEKNDGVLTELLSIREREVFRQLIEGRTNMEIAVSLCLSEATVKKHVSNIFRKMQVTSRVQLINRYFNTTFG
ncbi:LuxR C-terminal-related transcriptional regulator [Paenibacillus sp. GXUN7292]|uniref:LuxR C-terminal-related transcriptional regulator n=1 Tax=Paenibacillus sp. GXUN7292 TaxID=3422499 RepID=UPI003D7D3BCF